jgi:outer membrane protein assembly factor BamB
MRTRNLSTLSLLALICTLCIRADDWPQWLGPKRDGVWRESGILEKFPDSGPAIKWRAPIGAGYSGPAVSGGRVFLTDRTLAENAVGQKDPFNRASISGRERVLCLEEKTGKLLWKYEYDCAYGVSYAAGPRTTPVIDGGKVYTLGAEGNLLCLDADHGRVLWQTDFNEAYKIPTPLWGFAAHPLIDGNKLICLAGGDGSTVVAFEKNTGKELWRALSTKEPGYCPPMIYTVQGKRQLIIWTPEHINGLNPETGEVYWSESFAVRSGLSVPTPRVWDDNLFLTAFYDGARLYKFNQDKPGVTLVWKAKKVSETDTDTLHSIIPTPFVENGYVYGVCSYGELRCLKVDTGERVWETLAATTKDGKKARWANAFLVKNGDRFFIPNEKGDLIIAKLDPQGYHEISRAHLLDPTNPNPDRGVVWSHPAFANRSVYARNDKELVCADLAAK